MRLLRPLHLYCGFHILHESVKGVQLFTHVNAPVVACGVWCGLVVWDCVVLTLVRDVSPGSIEFGVCALRCRNLALEVGLGVVANRT